MGKKRVVLTPVDREFNAIFREEAKQIKEVQKHLQHYLQIQDLLQTIWGLQWINAATPISRIMATLKKRHEELGPHEQEASALLKTEYEKACFSALDTSVTLSNYLSKHIKDLEAEDFNDIDLSIEIKPIKD